MTVAEVREDGSVTLISDQLRDVTIVASKYHSSGTGCLGYSRIGLCAPMLTSPHPSVRVVGVDVAPGNQIEAVLLDVDLLTSEVHVSLLRDLTGKKKKKVGRSPHAPPEHYG